MEENAKKTSLKAQSAWLLFAKIVGFVFMSTLPLLIVRFLSPDEVGVYRQIFLVVANANAILPLGVGISAYYYLSREPERRGAAIFNIMLFNFVMGGLACATLVFYPQLLGRVFRSPEIVRLAPVIGFVIWFWVISSFLETVAIANQEARLATAFIISAQLTKTLLMVGAVVLFATVDAFVYAALFQAIIQTIILLFYLRSRFPRFWTKFDPSFLREQLIYALPFGFAGLLWTLQTDIHNYFVGYRFTEAEYAIYTTGCFELPLIGMISESVSSVMIPQMSKLQAAGDKKEMIRLVARAMQKLSFFYFPAYVFLVITAYTFITTLFTTKYEASVPIFLINITLIPFYIWVVDPVVRSYRELGRYLLGFRIFVFSGMVSALYFGIQNFGMRGMIGIVVGVVLFEKAVSSIAVMRKLEVGWTHASNLVSVAKTALGAIAAGVVLYFFYTFAAPSIQTFSAGFLRQNFSFAKPAFVDFLAGGIALGCCFVLYSTLYLACGQIFGFIDPADKRLVADRLASLRRLISKSPDAEVRPLANDL